MPRAKKTEEVIEKKVEQKVEQKVEVKRDAYVVNGNLNRNGKIYKTGDEINSFNGIEKLIKQGLISKK